MKRSFPIVTTALITSAGAFSLGWSIKSSQAPLKAIVEDRSSTAPIEPRSLMPTQRERSAEARSSIKASPAIASYMKNGTVSREDMGAAMGAMMKENDPLVKNAMFSALLDQLSPENAEAAFKALKDGRSGGRRGFGRGEGGDEMRLLLNAWGRIDGANAIATLSALAEAERSMNEEGQGGRGGAGGRGGRESFDIYSALEGWANSDADAALAYVNSLESEGEGSDRRKGMYTGGIVRGLMAKSVEDAVEFITSLPADESGSRGRYMESVASEMLNEGSASAAKWVDGLQADDLKRGAMDRVAESYAREDLDAAIAWVGEHANEAYASGAVTEVAERWAENDPQAVLDWAGDLPEATQQRVFEEALDEWTERDPMAASEYLAQMPNSPVKDSAVEGFAKELSRQDGEAAAFWAATIADEQLRTSTLQDVARDWLRQDRAAAETWLQSSSGLDAEAQQQIFESRGRGRGGRGR